MTEIISKNMSLWALVTFSVSLDLVEVSIAESKNNMSAQWDMVAVGDIFAKSLCYILDYS